MSDAPTVEDLSANISPKDPELVNDDYDSLNQDRAESIATSDDYEIDGSSDGGFSIPAPGVAQQFAERAAAEKSKLTGAFVDENYVTPETGEALSDENAITDDEQLGLSIILNEDPAILTDDKTRYLRIVGTDGKIIVPGSATSVSQFFGLSDKEKKDVRTQLYKNRNEEYTEALNALADEEQLGQLTPKKKFDTFHPMAAATVDDVINKIKTVADVINKIKTGIAKGDDLGTAQNDPPNVDIINHVKSGPTVVQVADNDKPILTSQEKKALSAKSHGAELLKQVAEREAQRIALIDNIKKMQILPPTPYDVNPSSFDSPVAVTCPWFTVLKYLTRTHIFNSRRLAWSQVLSFKFGHTTKLDTENLVTRVKDITDLVNELPVFIHAGTGEDGRHVFTPPWDFDELESGETIPSLTDDRMSHALINIPSQKVIIVLPLLANSHYEPVVTDERIFCPTDFCNSVEYQNYPTFSLHEAPDSVLNVPSFITDKLSLVTEVGNREWRFTASDFPIIGAYGFDHQLIPVENIVPIYDALVDSNAEFITYASLIESHLMVRDPFLPFSQKTIREGESEINISTVIRKGMYEAFYKNEKIEKSFLLPLSTIPQSLHQYKGPRFSSSTKFKATTVDKDIQFVYKKPLPSFDIQGILSTVLSSNLTLSNFRSHFDFLRSDEFRQQMRLSKSDLFLATQMCTNETIVKIAKGLIDSKLSTIGIFIFVYSNLKAPSTTNNPSDVEIKMPTSAFLTKIKQICGRNRIDPVLSYMMLADRFLDDAMVGKAPTDVQSSSEWEMGVRYFLNWAYSTFDSIRFFYTRTFGLDEQGMTKLISKHISEPYDTIEYGCQPTEKEVILLTLPMFMSPIRTHWLYYDN